MREKNDSIIAVVFSVIATIYYTCEYNKTNEQIYLIVLGFCLALVLFTYRNYKRVCKNEKAQRLKTTKTPKYKKTKIKRRKRFIWNKKKKQEPEIYDKYHDQYEAMWEELNKI